MGLIWSAVPTTAAAVEIRPPRRRNSRVSTVNQWQTESRLSSTHWASSSRPMPSAFLRAASRTRKPSPTEAHRVSTQRMVRSGKDSLNSWAHICAVW